MASSTFQSQINLFLVFQKTRIYHNQKPWTISDKSIDKNWQNPPPPHHRMLYSPMELQQGRTPPILMPI
jgi:hypothetical protein